MKQPTDTSIFLDKEKILESISKSGEYSTENVKRNETAFRYINIS